MKTAIRYESSLQRGRADASRFLVALEQARGEAWNDGRAWFYVAVRCRPHCALLHDLNDDGYVGGLHAELATQMEAAVHLRLPQPTDITKVLVIAVARNFWASFMVRRFFKRYHYKPQDLRLTERERSSDLLDALLATRAQPVQQATPKRP